LAYNEMIKRTKREIFMTLIFAHRGSSHTHPENTMIAFYQAQRVGTDGIELDVQLSKDGEVVVIHDFTVNRTTNGTGKVEELTLKELKRLNAGKKHLHQEIPTLREVFEWLQSNSLVCNVEIKKNHNKHQILEEKVIQLIHQFELQDRIIISSFNHYSIVYCYRLAPDIQLAPLLMEGIYMPWVYAKAIHAEGIHPHYKACPPENVQMIQSNGVAVRPFTVNKESTMKQYFQANVSAIITDFPEKAIKIKQQIK